MSATSPVDEIKLYFFGAPLIQRRGEYVSVDRQKAIALLAYLALTGQKHRRDVLANLLWPELDQTRARAGLRRVLRTLRAVIGPALVVADKETIGLRTCSRLWSDVIDFQQRLAAARVHGSPNDLDSTGKLLFEEAVALYRADLLAGFNLRDAPDFENWLCLERESLRRAVTSALEMLVRLHMAQGTNGPALDFAQRWLALEPSDERAHQAVMSLHLRNGDPAAARRQYEVCTKVLAEELDAPPSEETQLLLTGIDAKPAPHPAYSAVALAPALPLGETRLATVLVAGLGPGDEDELTPDAAGADFIERQERCLTTIRNVLRHYGGYIPPCFGDKLVVIFGIPASHEDDPERAVRAAIAVQHCAGAGLPVATGIHTGMVYLPNMAAAPGPETMILGSAIDVALRLYATARAGETLVTAATQRLTLGAVAYSAREARLPGARAATTVYCAKGLQTVARKVRGVAGLSAPLVGRGTEIAHLLDAVERLHREGVGCFVQIFGPPGVGKSRLVAELHDRLLVERAAAGETGVTWLEGRCTELTNETAYAPFREILRTVVQSSPDDDTEAKAHHFMTQLAALWQQAGLPATQLDEVAPFLGYLLSLRLACDNVTTGALAAEEIHYRTVEAIVALVTAIGSGTPSVLVIEDFQWADSHSLAVVERLAARLARLPVALICVARPQTDTIHALHLAARACSQHCTITMHLPELSPQESRQLVEQLLDLPCIPPALDSLVLARTEGNPFFIEETLRALMDDGVLIRHDESWSVDESRLPQAATSASAHVPEAVQSVILSRFDSQPQHIRRALQIAAVIGRTAPLAIFSRLLHTDSAVSTLLADLEQAGFVLAGPPSARTEFVFRHVLQQAVVYQTVGGAERRALHRQVAQAIASLWPEQEAEHIEQLAYHYSRSDDVSTAVEYLTKAGARAQQFFLNTAAIAAFEKALSLLAEMPATQTRGAQRATLLARLGRVQHTVGDFAPAAKNLSQAFDEGVAHALPAAELARWMYWLADALYWTGDCEAVLAVCQRAFAMLDIRPASQEAVILNQQMAGAYLSLDQKDRFITISLRTAECILCLPFTEELTSPFHHVIDACLACKQVERAWEFIDALRSRAQAAGNYRALAKAEFIAARTCSETGRHTEALVYGETALALAQQTGDAATTQFCLSKLMADAAVLGRLADAEHYAQRELRYALEAGGYGAEWLMLVAAIDLALDHPSAACTLLEQSLALAAKADFAMCGEANLWLGRAYQQMGKREDAIAQYEAVLQHSKPNTPSPPFMPDAKPASLLALAALDELLSDQTELVVLLQGLYAGPWRNEAHFTHARLAPVTMRAGELAMPPSGPSPLDWQWADPFGDCSWSLQEGGVEIRAANGRDLWWTNTSAPRLVCACDGDLCVQATCRPPDNCAPTLGGLLIWRDERNYLRLDYGSGGRHEVAFLGCIEGASVVIGRGRLPAVAGTLRLERAGSHVAAYCSADGRTWHTIGSVLFASKPCLAGVYAIGLIDRTIYPGAHAQGACIRFSALSLVSTYMPAIPAPVHA